MSSISLGRLSEEVFRWSEKDRVKKVLECSAPLAVERVITLLGKNKKLKKLSKTCLETLQQRKESYNKMLQGDLSLSILDLEDIKDPQILLVEKILRNVQIQPLSWLYARRLSIHNDIIESRIVKLRQNEESLALLLFQALSADSSFSLDTWRQARELKIFITSHVAFISLNGNHVSWDQFVKHWVKQFSGAQARVDSLYAQLENVSFVDELHFVPIRCDETFVVDTSFHQFVINYSFYTIFHTHLQIQCEKRIFTVLQDVFLESDAARQLALCGIAEIMADDKGVSGQPKSIPECTEVLQTLFLTSKIFLLAKQKEKRNESELYAQIFHSIAFFHCQESELKKRIDDFLQVREIVYTLKKEEHLDHLLDLCVNTLKGPLDAKLFIEIYKTQTKLAEELFEKQNIAKRMTYCMYLFSLEHYGKGIKREKVKIEHEAAFVDAMCYYCSQSYQTVERLLAFQLSKVEQIYLLAYAYSASIDSQTDEPLPDLQKYHFTTREMAYIAVNIRGKKEALDHFLFIQQFEEFLGTDLPKELVFACLLAHNLSNEFFEYPAKLKELQLKIAQLPLNRIEMPLETLEHIDDMRVSLAMQTTTRLSLQKQLYVSFENEYEGVLANLASISLRAMKNMEGGCQPFFPSELPVKAEFDGYFQVLIPKYPTASRAFLYHWTEDENGFDYHLNVLHSQSTFRSRSLSVPLKLSRKMLEDEKLLHIAHSMIRILSFESPCDEASPEEFASDLDACIYYIDKKMPHIRNGEELSFSELWQGYMTTVADAYEQVLPAFVFARDCIVGLRRLLIDIAQESMPGSISEELQSGNVYEIKDGLSLISRENFNNLPLNLQEAYSLMFEPYLAVFTDNCSRFKELLSLEWRTHIKLLEDEEVTICLERLDRGFRQTVSLVERKDIFYSMIFSEEPFPEAQAKLMVWQMMNIKSQFFCKF